MEQTPANEIEKKPIDPAVEAEAKAQAEAIEKKLKKSLDKSSSYNRNMLTIFLGILVYVFVTAATTTDMMLLIGSSMIKLPIIGYEVPLLYFCKYTPVIILIIHLNLLINLSLHAENYILWLKIGNNKPSYLVPFVFNYSYKYEQSKLFDRVIKYFVVGLYYILPIYILVWTAYKFLPYHDRGISIYQNSIATIDGMMSFLFYLQIAKLNNNIRLKQLYISFTVALIMTLLSWLIFCSVFVFSNSREDWLGLFHRNISLPRKTIVSKEISDVMIIHYLHDNKTKNDALREQVEMLDLRGRDLSYSNFLVSTFINANLNNANLQGANLHDVNLPEANLQYAKLQGANLSGASLQGANLISANLQGVSLFGANLQGVSLFGAKLQRVNLSGASLQGVDLSWARINCSTIDDTTNLNGIYYDNIDNLFKWNEISKIDNETAERCEKSDAVLREQLEKNKDTKLFLDINKKLACDNAAMAKSISRRDFILTYDNGTKVSFIKEITRHIKENCPKFLKSVEGRDVRTPLQKRLDTIRIDLSVD
ncbi:MAG: pentapeptide repeat-containing protein [Nitrospirae bacterium]|nr:pentapeptide repeat-containing protein [Nitrospirota bacterium]